MLSSSPTRSCFHGGATDQREAPVFARKPLASGSVRRDPPRTAAPGMLTIRWTTTPEALPISRSEGPLTWYFSCSGGIIDIDMRPSSARSRITAGRPFVHGHVHTPRSHHASIEPRGQDSRRDRTSGPVSIRTGAAGPPRGRGSSTSVGAPSEGLRPRLVTPARSEGSCHAPPQAQLPPISRPAQVRRSAHRRLRD